MRWLTVSCGGPRGRMTLRFRVLVRPWERLRGLLGTEEHAQPVALPRCRSVHTVGMRYALDLAFVTRRGTVLDVWRDVPPGRVRGNPRAWMVLERPHDEGRWLRVGETVGLSFEKGAQDAA